MKINLSKAIEKNVRDLHINDLKLLLLKEKKTIPKDYYTSLLKSFCFPKLIGSSQQ